MEQQPLHHAPPFLGQLHEAHTLVGAAAVAYVQWLVVEIAHGLLQAAQTSIANTLVSMHWSGGDDCGSPGLGCWQRVLLGSCQPASACLPEQRTAPMARTFRPRRPGRTRTGRA